MWLCHCVSVCNRLERSWCLCLHCLALVDEGPNLLWNVAKHPPNDTLSQPDWPESQLHCCGNVIQATTYRLLRTVLSVTDCAQLLRIAHSALFYPWPSEYNCCLLQTSHCFMLDNLCTTAAYCCFYTVLSVTIYVQLLLIAYSALFHPWSSVYDCCFSLTPYSFIRVSLCAPAVQFRVLYQHLLCWFQ